MSDVRRNAVYVGLFVAGAGAIFAGGILAVGTLQNAFSPKVTVHAVFDDVGGLSGGDMVWSSGMRVGVVQALTFLEPGKVDVTLRLDTAMIPFIPADSLATVGSDGLIGNPIVVLAGGSKEAGPIAEGATLAIGDAVSTAQIMETLQENNENLVAITGDLKELVAGIKAGEGTIGKLFADDALFDTVSRAMADIEGASANAKALTASLTTFSAGLNKPGNLPYELVHDKELMPSVRDTVSNLQAVADQTSAVVGKLSAILDDPASPVGVLLTDEGSGTDVRTMLKNLAEATDLLNEDLLAIQSNFLFRPYFKKKEKEERKKAKAEGK